MGCFESARFGCAIYWTKSLFIGSLVEEIANNMTDAEKDQLNKKSLYQKSDEWQNILQKKKKINQFDQPIKMQLDKIPSEEVGKFLQNFSGEEKDLCNEASLVVKYCCHL